MTLHTDSLSQFTAGMTEYRDKPFQGLWGDTHGSLDCSPMYVSEDVTHD